MSCRSVFALYHFFPETYFRKVDYMIDLMAYVSCFSTDKKGPVVFSNSPCRSFVFCIILVVVFWAMLLNCPRHTYRLYIAIRFEAKNRVENPLSAFSKIYTIVSYPFTWYFHITETIFSFAKTYQKWNIRAIRVFYRHAKHIIHNLPCIY